MSVANVSNLLHRLGGVYRDPSRVNRDASNLLRSSAGTHLKASTAPLVQNDGSSTPSVLLFSGTVAMIFRGNTYNTPVDIYLPPGYPVRPPVCFVRPVGDMVIKERHRNVATDGMVYCPYLHEWRPHNHDLKGLVATLSQIFGENPPLYAKPRTAPTRPEPPRTTTAVNGHPPSYDAIAARQQQAEAARIEQQQRAAAAEEEARIAAAKAASIEEQDRLTSETRIMLTSKLQHSLNTYFREARTIVSSDMKDQSKLERGTRAVESQRSALQNLKPHLMSLHETLDERTKELQSLVDHLSSSPAEEANVDDLVVPGDVHSAQMLQLSAENAGINDCLFFLDKKLAKGELPLDIHLKRVRKLAKKQFLVRAHLMKIGQVRASNGANGGTSPGNNTRNVESGNSGFSGGGNVQVPLPSHQGHIW
uniref:UEV domain-containing protein n=1 Tax=Helicotheca tamesis TaxID=374047 RepID=A0A7S2DW88_9STRA|mmetsp:Transcript_10336/g.14458  ORF Transcript_10336/g.14458 Transcript_10336/m.14458 type:complete len:421 (+) Transcript_10336:38-1300(+)|eukprot:CAMPEP_0185738286 /NCGR_PEP_ID=MMETSP1171-20130828/32470_1 /TAXON_ID=374046 /ORGANISM="Helicotheca tamensis, Strain CCMP826" /LENGTH=420 /DNA_ID=CAMNT_0028409455 /DNA_START=16 /DNA_END=1275 /DNA_ORIENTATION=+